MIAGAMPVISEAPRTDRGPGSMTAGTTPGAEGHVELANVTAILIVDAERNAVAAMDQPANRRLN